MQVQAQQFDTPFGRPLSVAVSAVGPAVEAAGGPKVVHAAFLTLDHLCRDRGLDLVGDDLGDVASAVRAYGSGDLLALAPVAVEQAGSDFRIAVWAAVAAIPPGHTLTYGQIAQEIGRPGAARAVGTACGANRVAPFVPCHRVVPSGGGVGSYGFGSELKAHLLNWELDLTR